MADDISNKLLQFALRNSNLKNLAIEPTDIKNEIARNAHKLSLSRVSRILCKRRLITAEASSPQTG